MAPLESYFYHLQAQTGADCFLLIRDDAMNSLSPVVSRESKSVEGSNCLKREPKFQPEKLDFNPPCPPKRLNSQDDLAMCKQTLKRALNLQTFTSSNRFQSLFGATNATGLSTVMSARHQADHLQEGEERNGLVSLAAPKFPMRKGSRDDLCTLPYPRTLMSPNASHSYPMANQKIDLRLVMDEVLGVVNETRTINKPVRTGSN